MMTPQAVKGAAQAAHYFDKDNYYMGGAEGPSAWWGAGAEALGLSGVVDRQQFEDALNGKLPDGTKLGTERDGKFEHRPGWDLTWSAPKSVSLMALVVGDTRLIEAHDGAVRAAMSHVQETLAHTRVRTNGEVQLVKTDNLIAALFHHDLNRDQEPQLHTHAVVLNATRTEDGQWRSLETKPIYQSIKESGAIYRSFLAAEVARLGYGITPGKDATFEIKGVPQQEIDRFSSRSAEIEALLEKNGLTRETATTNQKAAAALITRRAKEAVDRPALLRDWIQRLGTELPPLQDLRRAAEGATQGSKSFDRTHLEATGAVLRAANMLAEREQVFSDDRLHAAALRFAIGQANPDAIRTAITSLVVERMLVPRTAVEPTRETRADTELEGYTTPDAIKNETRLFSLLDQAKSSVKPVVSASTTQAAVAAAEARSAELGHQWNEDQRTAATGILRSRDSVTLLQGFAGTAKTSTVLAAVAATAQSAGYNVHALAPQASPAKELGSSLGMKGQTVHEFLGGLAREADQPKPILQRIASLFSKPKELWIVDEMGLLGTSKTNELLTAAQAHGARVVLTGDTLQLGSVEAGRAFAQAQDRALDTFRLDKIVRQKTEPGRAAVRSAINRKAAAVLHYLERDQGQVIDHRDAQERVSMIAQMYTRLTPQERENTILIDPSREGNEAIKGEVRTLLQMQGELTGPRAQGTRLLDAGLANAEKTVAHMYDVGYVLRPSAKMEGIDGSLAKDQYGLVVGVDAANDRIRIRKDDGKVFTIAAPDIKANRLDVFEPHHGELQKGDRVRWNRNDKPRGLARGDFGTITDVQGDTASFAFDNGNKLTADVTERQNQHYDYGYAVTAYGAQGRTKNWIFHAESWRINLVNWRSFYVAISRGETSGTIITNNRDALIDAVAARAGEKSVAIDTRDLGRSVRQAATAAIGREASEHSPTTHAPGSESHSTGKVPSAATKNPAPEQQSPTPTSPTLTRDTGPQLGH